MVIITLLISVLLGFINSLSNIFLGILSIILAKLIEKDD